MAAPPPPPLRHPPPDTTTSPHATDARPGHPSVSGPSVFFEDRLNASRTTRAYTKFLTRPDASACPAHGSNEVDDVGEFCFGAVGAAEASQDGVADCPAVSAQPAGEAFAIEWGRSLTHGRRAAGGLIAQFAAVVIGRRLRARAPASGRRFARRRPPRPRWLRIPALVSRPYGDQLGHQAHESWTTSWPSRSRTTSRVSQVPYWMIQWGNLARE